MAGKKKRKFVRMQCQECQRINYYSPKSRNVEGKLALKKFCKWCRKHTIHKETKK
ncbi:MAG: 50S ribosomal protein L33 [Candidatus Nealsonbacteria bacterium]|nr:MAG: 50S ribosomal protein L33 [Candidatus Nealsonbacteria bacterium]